jgi:hypothetical protein
MSNIEFVQTVANSLHQRYTLKTPGLTPTLVVRISQMHAFSMDSEDLLLAKPALSANNPRTSLRHPIQY